MTEVLTLEEILENHIAKTKSVKVAHALAPIAKKAIELVNEGEHDVRLELPTGIRTLNPKTLEYQNTAYASDIVYFCELWEWLNIDRIIELEKNKRKGEIDG